MTPLSMIAWAVTPSVISSVPPLSRDRAVPHGIARWTKLVHMCNS
jgi:hypothetical protein